MTECSSLRRHDDKARALRSWALPSQGHATNSYNSGETFAAIWAEELDEDPCKRIREDILQKEKNLKNKRVLLEAKLQELIELFGLSTTIEPYLQAAKYFIETVLYAYQHKGISPEFVTGFSEAQKAKLRELCKTYVTLETAARAAQAVLANDLLNPDIQKCLPPEERERIREKIIGKKEEEWRVTKPYAERIRQPEYYGPPVPLAPPQPSGTPKPLPSYKLVRPVAIPDGMRMDWLTPDILAAGTVIATTGGLVFLAVTAPAWLPWLFAGATVIVLASVVAGEKPRPKT